ncbi:MAG: twin-arginine translocation signal domain-containing protein, partial [Anaerolineae bacterium]
MFTKTSAPPLTRRQFLKAAGGLSAVVALTDLPLAPQPVDAARVAVGQSVVSLHEVISDDPVAHVVRRLTFGPTPE